MGEPSPTDPRMDFLGAYVQKTLKLKPEKWTRMMGTEEHKGIVMKFLERPSPLLLVIVLTHTLQLVASNGFPLAQLKTKGVFFIKKSPAAIPKTDFRDNLLMGDLACKIIDQLATIVDEMFVPLLSNPLNHDRWPAVIAQDVQKHVHSLKSTVYQVKGQVNGQTVLPMPVGVEKVEQAEQDLVASNGEVIDLYLKSAIEAVVIKWAGQIHDVLQNDSSDKTSGPNPVPSIEIQFWNWRMRNLQFIYEQLREQKVKSMAVILEKTDSAYFGCFKDLFRNVVLALSEAQDICRYLKPLQKHLARLEEIDFSECAPLLAPLIHVVCLIWCNSQHYCQVKFIVLLKQIGNLLIQQAKKYLDPSSIFQTDIDEAMLCITLSIGIMKKYQRIFLHYKENLAKIFADLNPKPWTFHANTVFERYNLFLERMNTIQWFFHTVVEFTKLEKIEIGGLKGRGLSARIRDVSAEFQACFVTFGGKTYDVLDPDDPCFMEDYEEFQNKIYDMDLKLAAILCQAFEDCSNLESIFKLINIVGTVLDRPLIKDEFTSKYSKIITMLDEEMDVGLILFEEQMSNYTKFGQLAVDTYLPPVAGSLMWTNQLRQRISNPMTCFKALQHPIVDSPEGLNIIKKYDNIIDKMAEFDKKIFDNWKQVVPKQIEDNLEQSLYYRNIKTHELYLNFHPQLAAILREVHYLKLIDYTDLPECALQMEEKSEVFRKYIINLNITIDWYNKIRRTTRDVEFKLIEAKVNKIDELVSQGQTTLNWNSDNLWDYVSNILALVTSLQQHVTRTQDNLNEIQAVLTSCSRRPLFERRDARRDAVLAVEDRAERTQKRYADITAAADRVVQLLEDNLQVFEMTERKEDELWRKYVKHIDGIVMENMFKAVGCSLGYISEHMDSTNNLSPLFEAQLELKEPNLVFIPSLEPNSSSGFHALVTQLIEDILHMPSFIPRLISSDDVISYREEIEQHQDIVEMKADILSNIETVIRESNDFCDSFQTYSYLWLEDRNVFLKQFLLYGRALNQDEMDLVQQKDSFAPKPNPPKMEMFREQIDNFEMLYAEVEQIKTEQIFRSWFKVDSKPFKQALLNTVRKWGNMFKDHLVNNVTNKLSDLANFIRKADEGLQQTVMEGDYNALINVMGYLMHVKERQVLTDDMFGPLRDTIELLKFYDMDIPEEVNVLLQELPEQWANTKKIAVTIKQQVAPLQAAEVTCIRKRIQEFEGRVAFFREVFKRFEFFTYVCEDPYKLMDRIDADIKRFEKYMRDIQDSGSLFEVSVPDFKMLKQCRKELRMLKQLWDYIFIVRTCVDDWKKTPWRKIDVENMDIECKKFAKEIRMLDKEMRGWDTYLSLEGTVKNTLTSFRAVGELQNPAIRERHWNQLMKSTKVMARRRKQGGR